VNIVDLEAIQKLHCNAAPTNEEIKILTEKLDFDLDKDFLGFLTACDGGEGFVSENKFLQMWTIRQIMDLNPYYPDISICNELYFFGSDGSNLGFAIDKHYGTVVSIDFLEIGQAEPHFEGASFRDFLARITTTAKE
jgi:hypothetical protein